MPATPARHLSALPVEVAGPAAPHTPARHKFPLRITTSGSVDDGKSTLIGRLLYDARAIPEDQLAAVHAASARRGEEAINLSLLTDGLRAEREQGITIDVAYRYFGTPTRRFIIADAPGHAQYTRNMATAASVSDLAIILIDARLGITEQTRRHTLIASLMRVPAIVVAVNKCDLVNWDREVFDRIAAAFRDLARGLGIEGEAVIPVSALHGDNIVRRGDHSPWYSGPTLIEILHTTDAGHVQHVPFRLPVQYVIRPRSDEHHDYRGYAGAIASGSVRPGDQVVVLPAGHRTRIARVHLGREDLQHAEAPLSIAVTLADDVDVSRGDIIAALDSRPAVADAILADVVWMDAKPLQAGARYLLKHTTNRVRAVVQGVDHVLDLETMERAPAADLVLNDIGRVRLRTSAPLVFDPYERSRSTGSFILIDEQTGGTVGGGIILGTTEPAE